MIGIAFETDNNIIGYEFMKAITTDSDGKLPLVVTEVSENNVIKVYYVKKFQKCHIISPPVLLITY